MWIVRLALGRPYTFVVLAICLLLAGPLMILRTPTDIFPSINIPVVSVVWSYNGLSAEDMSRRIVTGYERSLTNSVDDIEHIESQTLSGVSVIKVFFHPGADINRAIAQTTSGAQSLLKTMPPGTTAPLILSYSASTVPILRLALGSDQLPEQELYDLGNNFIRTQLATVQGASVPLPYGGKVRQVMVDLDTRALQARGLAPLDVVNAINAQNLILPGGTAKIGALEYRVDLNGSTQTVAALNDLPVTSGPGGVVYVRDVAQVHDGYAPQTNVVRRDGKRAALLEIEKSGNTSTLSIIAQIKAMLPKVTAGLPKSLQVQPISDQSVFVTSAIDGVLHEALIAACLTALMILLFLGSWRSTLIIAITIPLSVLAALIALSALGETLNIMTLGGLALAVGVLVDDATVAIENITHHREMGKPLETAILDGSAQIALPTLVSTLCICIVFLPMFMLSGVARYLFVPMAEAVVFAMMASYFLSRTLIPTLAHYLLRGEAADGPPAAQLAADAAPPPGHLRHIGSFLGRLFHGLHQRFEHAFEAVRLRYAGVLRAALAARRRTVAIFLIACAGSMALVPFLGQDFFPSVDSGEIRLHMRARTGTRIEETARIADQVEASIRQTIGPARVASIVDDIGLPVSGINLTYDAALPIGTADAEILVSVKPGSGGTAADIDKLGTLLPKAFPGVSFSFLPADIVSQILNFGLPAPIDVQIVGNDLAGNRVVANRLARLLTAVPGLADVHLQQPADQPALTIDVDRTRALQAGLSQRDVAQNLLISLSGSGQTSPNFWLNPKNGVSYPLMVSVPQYAMGSLQALANIPLGLGADTAAQGGAGQVGLFGTVTRTSQQGVVSHYNVQPVLDIFGAVRGRDLGAVATDIDRIVARVRKDLPAGSDVVVRGQVQTMRTSFVGLVGGLGAAMVLVYLLMVVNFQSWLDPLAIVGGLPVALSGMAWMLFATGTTISVPALTGAIMCIGIATANSILVVSRARELLGEGMAPVQAAFEAGTGRFRPVAMTALAMLFGMVPMALGAGSAGAQNAPLGRAVIGGLAFGSIATLVLVPVFFAMLHHWLGGRMRVAQSPPATSPVTPSVTSSVTSSVTHTADPR
ncbi:Multidrug efflux pump subunit AcrB [Cupriavidus sp. YR651]|uniref:efflux RND transporter permease subunit n=1 Tax=Cupriavidus sp. YR651 TaxID=1855315 RepID=UPI00088F1AEF|nr:efflux RND transporter permease subunit [Cupriavidus sp. YR651]SDD37426.1 Multidrug efflux pump subunit AcrB [Cupriavidus sp. YR651]